MSIWDSIHNVIGWIDPIGQKIDPIWYLSHPGQAPGGPAYDKKGVYTAEPTDPYGTGELKRDPGSIVKSNDDPHPDQTYTPNYWESGGKPVESAAAAALPHKIDTPIQGRQSMMIQPRPGLQQPPMAQPNVGVGAPPQGLQQGPPGMAGQGMPPGGMPMASQMAGGQPPPQMQPPPPQPMAPQMARPTGQVNVPGGAGQSNQAIQRQIMMAQMLRNRQQ